MQLSLCRLCFFIFIFISIPGFTYAEDENLDTIDLDFEIPEVEKKPYSFKTEFKISETIKRLDNDSLIYHQRYPDGKEDDTLYQTDLNLKVEGSYQISIVKLYARLNGDLPTMMMTTGNMTGKLKKLMCLCFQVRL